MYVCTYVCMDVCVYLCLHVCMYLVNRKPVCTDVFHPGTGPPSAVHASLPARWHSTEATHPGHFINPTVTVLFNEPQYHRRLVLEALAGGAKDPASSMNFDWEASQDQSAPLALASDAPADLPMCQNSGFSSYADPRPNSLSTADYLPMKRLTLFLRWTCTTIPNLSTPQNLTNIIYPICLCRDVQHLIRRELGLLKTLRITSERFGNCPFARCRFCCGSCLQRNTTCPFHRSAVHVMKKYADSIPSNVPSEPVACRRCGLLIRRVAPLLCNGPCGRVWHPGCIPPAQRADRSVWKCKNCLAAVFVPDTRISPSLLPLPASPPASPTRPPPQQPLSPSFSPPSPPPPLLPL